MDKNMFSKETLEWVRRLRDAALVSETGGAIRAGGTPFQSEDKLRPVLDGFRTQSRQARIEVIEALSEEADSLTTKVLLAISDCDEDWQLRLRVLGGLVAGPLDEGLKALMHVARNDIDPEVRAEAIRRLGNWALEERSQTVGRAPTIPPMQGAIRTGAGTISREAPFREQADAVLQFLDQLRSRDHSADVRRAADEALRRIDH
jgi:hypothetical protein